jgi:peptidoglycan/xylan/chitin deacetylase (PgdA/CDA1 family)
VTPTTTPDRGPGDDHTTGRRRRSWRILLAALTVAVLSSAALLVTPGPAALALSPSARPMSADLGRTAASPAKPDPKPKDPKPKDPKPKDPKPKDPKPKNSKSKDSKPKNPEPPTTSPTPTYEPRPMPVRVVPAPPVIPPVPPPPAPTVVSLTFDDGLDNQMAGAAVLEKYGLKGTFYVNSGTVDSAGHMTQSDLNDLAAEGHEIGGHTVNHVPLTSTPQVEAARQICTDRATLTDWGFRVRSFAYPFGLLDPATVKRVEQCGYSSARGTGDLREPFSVGDTACAECDLAEPIPPANPFVLRTPGEVQPNWRTADLESLVIQASRNGGGWLPLVFHQICDDCSDIAVQEQTLDSFAYWLAHSAPPGTSVKTVGDVIGGPADAVRSAPPGTVTTVSNPSLEAENPPPPVDAGQGSEDPPDWRPGIPLCWQAGGYGRNTTKFSRTQDAHSGSSAERMDVSDYVDGDAKLLTKMDLGECAPNARPGESYILSSWYKSTSPAQYSVYYRTASGLWKYWTSSPWFDPTDRWTQATWATPPAPLGATAVSFGLGLASAGSLVTDDYGLVAVSSPGLVTPGGKLLLLITAGILLAILVISLVQHIRGRLRRRRAEPVDETTRTEEEPTRIPAPTGRE